jgi:putative membrane protein
MTHNAPPLDERTLLAQERTRLAAERTFLAWLRTGLTGIGIGIAISKFVFFETISHQRTAHLVGQFLILWGLCTFLFALNSYYKSLKKISSSGSSPGNPSFVGLSLITAALIFFSLTLFWIIIDKP